MFNDISSFIWTRCSRLRGPKFYKQDRLMIESTLGQQLENATEHDNSTSKWLLPSTTATPIVKKLDRHHFDTRGVPIHTFDNFKPGSEGL
ncbi:Protein of unknown function [Pyronema omphalodes CBS 100304]|uniref:Uncharacterized protein n=1 Tax=Pyronema omphalodes (strain CBS 100304) TaxID=1076935 RepID=U4LCI7_PYROM|nr:Protein of unknown function [Pyronema omphalodes CBS 100304]